MIIDKLSSCNNSPTLVGTRSEDIPHTIIGNKPFAKFVKLYIGGNDNIDMFINAYACTTRS